MSAGKKILITGGHLTPALATIEVLLQADYQVEFVGRRFTDQQGSKSKEEIEVEKLGVKFHGFDAPKHNRFRKLELPLLLPRLLYSVFIADRLLGQIKPDLLLSFGGYLALPIAVAAKFRNIPIITHEQTLNLGLANQIIGRLSQLIAVSWPITQLKWPQTSLTGNPIRHAFFKTYKNTKYSHEVLPVIYITGGNQGSSAINNQVFNSLEELLQDYQIIHQTGDSRSAADLKLAKKISKNLPPKLKQKYLYQAWFEADEVSQILDAASLVVSRAGANTLSELIVKSKRSILIPLPTGVNVEQAANAKFAQELGFAKMLNQENISQLAAVIKQELAQKFTPNTQIETLRQLHLNGAKNLLAQIEQVLAK